MVWLSSSSFLRLDLTRNNKFPMPTVHFVELPPMFRSSRLEVFCNKDVLGNFAKFTGKHLCQSLFLNKVAGLGLQLYLKKETLTQVLSCEFCKICKNTFFIDYYLVGFWICADISSTDHRNPTILVYLSYRTPLGDCYCAFSAKGE